MHRLGAELCAKLRLGGVFCGSRIGNDPRHFLFYAYDIGMTRKVDVAALAKLVRLEVSNEELAKLEKEITDILHFVETIKKAHTAKEEKSPELRNVMREDANPHESGLYTDDLLAAAPVVRDNQIVVKQVISRKK